MSAELDEEDSLQVCTSCGQLSVIVTSKPLPSDLVGRGAGPCRAFQRLCASCAPGTFTPVTRSSRSYASTPIRNPWWDRD
jgi:hypothetical protein